MASFLLTLWPFPTHIRPFFAVGKALAERGHDVAVYVGGEAVELAEGEGFDVFPFDRLNWATTQQDVANLLSGQGGLLRYGALWRKFLIDAAQDQVEDIRDILARRPVDVIVCDLALCGPFLVTREQSSVPVAMLSHVAGCLIPGPGAPTMGSVADRNVRGLPKLAASVATGVAAFSTRAVPRAANALRARHGLAPMPGSLTEFSSAMDLYLQPGSSAFDYDRTLPPHAHYVGPCLWDKPADQPPPAWIDSIPRNRPWVLVEEGALFVEASPLLDAAVASLAALDAEVIVLRGEGRPPGEPHLASSAPNIHVHDWTPLTDLLDHVELVVTNANSDSVFFTLDRGKPMVAAPSIWDQNETARQIEHSGCGVRLTPKALSPQSLLAAAREVIASPNYAEAAKKIGGDIRAQGGPNVAAALLESLASARVAHA